MRIIVYLILISQSCLAITDSDLVINQLRNNMADIITNKNKIEFSIQALSSSNSPTGIAYRGMLKACLASYLNSPLSKLKSFTAGRQEIEKAVYLSPQSCEIRFIRLLIQSKSPSFLFYKDNLNEDKQFILHSLKSQTLNENIRRMINSNMNSLSL